MAVLPFMPRYIGTLNVTHRDYPSTGDLTPPSPADSTPSKTPQALPPPLPPPPLQNPAHNPPASAAPQQSTKNPKNKSYVKSSHLPAVSANPNPAPRTPQIPHSTPIPSATKPHLQFRLSLNPANRVPCNRSRPLRKRPRKRF